MFRTILVALDGSSFGEEALPWALGLARRAGANLDLVHVHTPKPLLQPSDSARYVYDPSIEIERRREEQLYLSATEKWLAAVSPVPTTSAVVSGPPTEGILERIKEVEASLLVMATHGRGPVGRFFLGGVVDELVRQATIPMLLVRSTSESGSESALVPEPLVDNVLVALDGSALAEEVLGPAVDLARLLGSCCTLLRVVETEVKSSGGIRGLGPSPEVSGETVAHAYLKKVVGRLSDERVPVQTQVVVSPRADEAILEAAKSRPGDVIALATHGHGGLRRIILGSVADKVIRGTANPILVVRPPW